MNWPTDGGPHTAKTSFIEGRANLIKKHFPDSGGSLYFIINDRGKIIAKGPRGGDIQVFQPDKKINKKGKKKYDKRDKTKTILETTKPGHKLKDSKLVKDVDHLNQKISEIENEREEEIKRLLFIDKLKRLSKNMASPSQLFCLPLA